MTETPRRPRGRARSLGPGFPTPWLTALLGLTILQLPFEIRTPVISIGPLAVTNLEAAAYLALVVAAAAAVLRNAAFDALDWTLLAWCAAWLAAGLAAPGDHASALRHAGRMMVGPMLCLLVRPLLDPDRAGRLARLFAGATAAAAAIALADLVLPEVVGPLLNPFRAERTYSLFGVRASGPFEYANQLAGFLDLGLPFLAVAAVGAGLRRGLWKSALAAAALASLFSLSRSGWGAGAVAVAVALLAAGRGTGGRLPVALGLATLALAAFLAAPRLRSRLLAPHVPPAFAYTIAYKDAPSPRIVVTNAGSRPWRAAGRNRVELSVHGRRLAPSTKEAEVFLPLPRDVEPGETAVIPIDPGGTLPDGRYVHVYDLRHTVHGYGAQWGMAPVTGRTVVRDGVADVDYAPGHGTLRREKASRARLWRAAARVFADHPLLGVGPGEFQRRLADWLPAVEPDTRLHPNQLLLHHLAEGGLAAALTGLGVVAASCWLLRGGLRRRRTRGVAAAGLGALAGWLAHGLFDSFLLFNGCALAFWAALALALPRGEPVATRTRLSRS